MGPTRSFTLAASALFLAWTGPAAADQYRAGELLNLDLSKAVLSSKRIGPPAEFAPVAVEAREEPSVDYRLGARTTSMKSAPSDNVEIGAEPKRKVASTPRVKQANVEKPRPTARTKVVKRSNPLDAQAMDTRIQKWPCKSGGICDWKR